MKNIFRGYGVGDWVYTKEDKIVLSWEHGHKLRARKI